MKISITNIILFALASTSLRVDAVPGDRRELKSDRDLLGGCPEPYTTGTNYDVGDVVTVVKSATSTVYQCGAAPNNLYCGMLGFEPGTSIHWEQAWSELGSCTSTFQPSASPVYVSITDAGGCPGAFDGGAVYEEGDKIAKDGLVYECKSFPTSKHCSQSGFEPGTSIGSGTQIVEYWKQAWKVTGYCDGTITPTSTPTSPSSSPSTITPSSSPNEISGTTTPTYSPSEYKGTIPPTSSSNNITEEEILEAEAYVEKNVFVDELFPSTNIPLVERVGECPDEWSAQRYEEGDRVSSTALVYECKPWPQMAHCGQAGYKPGGILGHPDAWEDAWTLVGFCDGTNITSSPNEISDSKEEIIEADVYVQEDVFVDELAPPTNTTLVALAEANITKIEGPHRRSLQSRQVRVLFMFTREVWWGLFWDYYRSSRGWFWRRIRKAIKLTIKRIHRETQAMIDETNTALAASGVIHRLYKAGLHYLTCLNEGKIRKQYRMSKNDVANGNFGSSQVLNGVLGNIGCTNLKRRRDYRRADLVTVIAELNGMGSGGSSARSLEYWDFPGGNPAENAYLSVVKLAKSRVFYQFAHEIGHNCGLGHDLAVCTYCGLGAGRGFVVKNYVSDSQPGFRTIMAYRNGCCDNNPSCNEYYDCYRIPRFSNPNVYYAGLRTGSQQANSALTLNYYMERVSRYR